MEASRLRQAWASELFLAFCASIDATRARGDLARRIPDHAALFAVLDGRCAGIGEITQQRLLDLFGAEGMRRADLPVRFLVGHLSLAWEVDAGATNSDRQRIAGTRAAVRDQPWLADLDAFREHLAAGREIAAGTARMYMAAASALLHSAGVGRAGDLTQVHVRRYLHRYRGRRTNIMRFLSWVSGRSGAFFEVGKGWRTPPRKREKATLRGAGHLLEHLAAIRDQRAGRAVLAATIAVLHHVPRTRVLALRQCDVAVDGEAVTLWPGEADLKLAAPLAAGFVRFAATGQLAFPGRNGVQPLTVSAVRHHVPPRSQRSNTGNRIL